MLYEVWFWSFGPLQEIYYYPTMRKEFTKEDSTGERVPLKGEKADMDKDFLECITADTGLLTAGALPSLDLATKDGEKAMAESLAGPVQKAKAPKRPRQEAPTEVKPTTAKQTSP